MTRIAAWLSGIAATLLTFACGPVPGTYAQTTQTTVTVEPGARGRWISGSPAQTRVLVGDDGQTYVGVWVEAPERVARPTRSPMAVALVIDTSGSMSGQKITNARMAASSFLETLRDGDIVSLFGFSDGVTELAPPTVIGSASPRLADSLRAGSLSGRRNQHVPRLGQRPKSPLAGTAQPFGPALDPDQRRTGQRRPVGPALAW